jgi:hypothetical protein
MLLSSIRLLLSRRGIAGAWRLRSEQERPVCPSFARNPEFASQTVGFASRRFGAKPERSGRHWPSRRHGKTDSHSPANRPLPQLIHLEGGPVLIENANHCILIIRMNASMPDASNEYERPAAKATGALQWRTMCDQNGTVWRGAGDQRQIQRLHHSRKRGQ